MGLDFYTGVLSALSKLTKAENYKNMYNYAYLYINLGFRKDYFLVKGWLLLNL